MRQGIRVYDADTHVQPTTEVVEPYLDKATLERVGDLDRYKVPIKIGLAGEIRTEPYKHYWRFNEGGGWGGDTPRHLGEAGPRAKAERHFQTFMGKRTPTDGGIDDPLIRLKDMDEEGVDVQLMVPSGANGHQDPAVEMGFIQANDRFMNDFCATDPHRLKSLIVVTARSVQESVKEIEAWGDKPWVIGIQPYMPLDYPIDHPDLDPIWKAAADRGLAVVHHSFASGYPGYRDMWQNPFLGRLGSHPWGAMRSMAAFMAGGVMDRFPTIKYAILESGFGWLPFWGKRMDDQVTYMGYVAEGLKHKPSEYMVSGRFAASIVLHEGAEMVKLVNDSLGDQILMFGSDYPHAESRFPESTDVVLRWDNLDQQAKQRLMWDNAVRFFGEP